MNRRRWSQEMEPRLEEIRRKIGHQPQDQLLRVLRVNQIDALVLDNEMLAMLLAMLRPALDRLGSGVFLRYRQILDVVVRLFIYMGTTWRHVQTPGNAFQNLRFRNEGFHRERRHLARTLEILGIASLCDSASRSLFLALFFHGHGSV